MRPLWALFAVAIAATHAYPTGNYGGYVYPAHPSPSHYEDDFSHRFHYKEYFPPPPEIGVGHLDSKLYASSHAYPSLSSNVEYITSSIGHHLENKAHAVKDAISSVSDNIGGKVSYLTSGIHDPFKGYYVEGGKNIYAGGHDSFKGYYAEGGKNVYAGIQDPFKGYYPEGGKAIYANGYAEYGHHDGEDKLKTIAHGVGSAVSGSVSALKTIGEGISNTVSGAAKSVGETIGSAVHTVQVAGSDLSDHLSRSAVHVRKGISGTISDTTYTTKTLFGILGEFLGSKVQIIRDGAGKHFNNAGHALSQASAAVARQVGRAALGVGEFLQNKAHEINYSIQKKVLRNKEHAPLEYAEPLKHELPAGGVIDSGYAVSSLGPSVYGGVDGVGYGLHKSAHLFQPTKVAVQAIPFVSAPLPVATEPKYVAESYVKL